MSAQLPLTAIVISKDEQAAIARCIKAVSFVDQVIVVDSSSTDRTVEIARSLNAEVLNFTWNGAYPKKKQWGIEHASVRHDWVLTLDADEIVTPSLAEELRDLFKRGAPSEHAAFDIQLDYTFAGRTLRHGHRVRKRSLLNRTLSRFPEIKDLNAPGITEVEGHYQPKVAGSVGLLSQRILHDDPDPVASWIARHNRYSDWEAYLRTHPQARETVRDSRSRQGQVFERVPFKPFTFFVYSFVFRGGFLDGRAGFDYAYALAFYYWMISAKVREIERANRSTAAGDQH